MYRMALQQRVELQQVDSERQTLLRGTVSRKKAEAL